ncbi:MAG: Pr6Pr family membrane protein [Clostridia bacterium]
MIKNKIYPFIWRILLCLIGVVGLGIMFGISSNVGQFFEKFVYFTVQSNIFVVILFVYLAIKSCFDIQKKGLLGQSPHISPTWQVALVFYITITFVVYAVLLSGADFSMDASATTKVLYKMSNIMVHYIVPLMAIFDWIMFLPHGKLKFVDAFKWLIYPVLYLIFIVVRALVGGYLNEGRPNASGNPSKYPYAFVDFDVLGAKKGAITVFCFLIAFILLGIIFVCLDKLFAKAQEKLESKFEKVEKESSAKE